MSFAGPLTDEHLDRAETRSRRPLDRTAIRRRARELGIPVRESSADPVARELIARLRRGAPLDPRLGALLREQLSARSQDGVPEQLDDVAEWIGASELERGRALRDVLRLYGAIERSREPVRVAEREPVPRIRSKARRSAS